MQLGFLSYSGRILRRLNGLGPGNRNAKARREGASGPGRRKIMPTSTANAPQVRSEVQPEALNPKGLMRGALRTASPFHRRSLNRCCVSTCVHAGIQLCFDQPCLYNSVKIEHMSRSMLKHTCSSIGFVSRADV